MARKSGNDKALKQAASRRIKMEDRMGMEKNAKGHRFRRTYDMVGYNLKSRIDIEHEQVDPVCQKRCGAAGRYWLYGQVKLLLVVVSSFGAPLGIWLHCQVKLILSVLAE
jgi:hypothetical protein